ncbi:MAG: zinc metallopeptidase [Pseudomonadota bacterium]|nr:zinc metallopeptidase [Pseudomonadota bacterium]
MWYYIIGGLSYLASLLIRGWLDSAYRKWGAVANSRRLTGADTSRTILHANRLDRVGVQAVRGRLTDHYDPRTKAVSLSEKNYSEASVAALAVAAHETGHALQDADGYRFMQLRSALVPLANLSAQVGPYAFMYGLIGGSAVVLQIGALLFAGAVLFHLVTLPVEFNASRRALRQIEALGLVSEAEYDGAKTVLRAAGMTYVAAAATSFAYLLYMLAWGRRRR